MEIELSGGHVVVVDEQDFPIVRDRKWNVAIVYGKDGENRHVYAQSSVRIKAGVWRTILMHRLIMNAPSGLFVDHVNGNGLDNRKENLRICNNTQNQQNQVRVRGKSQYKGVYWHSGRSKWCAHIRIFGKMTHLGSFDLERDAAIAYDIAANGAFGDFANTNKWRINNV